MIARLLEGEKEAVERCIKTNKQEEKEGLSSDSAMETIKTNLRGATKAEHWHEEQTGSRR